MLLSFNICTKPYLMKWYLSGLCYVLSGNSLSRSPIKGKCYTDQGQNNLYFQKDKSEEFSWLEFFPNQSLIL
jgi:hypothetical protein